MSIRNTLLSIAIGFAFASPAFAIDGAAFVGELGEPTYGGPPAHQDSATTRASVRDQVQSARENGTLRQIDGALTFSGVQRASTAVMGAAPASDVSPDGFRFIGGELGYVPAGPRGVQ
jgi:hypothetical protein